MDVWGAVVQGAEEGNIVIGGDIIHKAWRKCLPWVNMASAISKCVCK